ncbi:MAG: hypothetical protein PVF83_18745 [Anaerolineales bacterium]|jgi:hypothetical protein
MMDNGMIRKFEKAKMYAEERDRIEFESFKVRFAGKNNPHVVQFSGGKWECDCEYFIGRGRCSHTMALEIILHQMLPEPIVD